MKISWTLVKRFNLLIAVFLLVFVLVILGSVNIIVSRSLDSFFRDDIRSKSAIVKATIKDLEQKSLEAGRWFENSQLLVNALKSRDRETLINNGKLAMASFGLDYFVVADDQANVIARADSSQQFGENIYGQANIQKAFEGQQSVGIEEGSVVKYTIRAGTPIKDANGNILGAVSLGYVLSQDSFVDRLKNLTGCEITIFKGDTRINTTIIQDGKRIVDTKMEQQDILDTVLTKGKEYNGNTTILGIPYIVEYLPIVDVSGKTTGMFFVGENASIMSKLSKRLMTSQVAILVVVGIIFFFIITFAVRHLIIQKIVVVANQIHEVSQGDGDLTKKLMVSSEDEFSSMMRDFNVFVEKIRDIVKSISDLSINLSASAEQMSSATSAFSDNAQSQAAAVEEVNATTEELHAGIEQIAGNTISQAESMKELAGKMKELSDAITDTETRIRQTLDLTNAMVNNAKEGGRSLDAMTVSMNKISDSSGKMNNIVRIINDISDQINLLSLNAAIESARAGDAGRGFAVVADEISKLADQTASSIKDIDVLIKMNEEEISSGISNVAVTNETIGAIIRDVDLVTSMMQKVSSDMRRQSDANLRMNDIAEMVNHRTDEINRASAEHRIATTEIVEATGKINERTQSIASGAEELDATAHDISNMSEVLQDKVSFFKV